MDLKLKWHRSLNDSSLSDLSEKVSAAIISDLIQTAIIFSRHEQQVRVSIRSYLYNSDGRSYSSVALLSCGTTISSALTYIVLGYAIGSQPVPNVLPIAQDPFQIQAASRNYTYTPGIGAHRVHSGLATWNAARRICEEQGSHLVILNSLAEAEAVGQLLNKSGGLSAWTGAHDLYQEDEFVTIHGESLSQAGYDVWRKGEPNDTGGKEDCLLVSTEGKLADANCNARHNFICELPYVQSYVLQVPVQPRLRPASELVANPGIA